MTPCLETAQRSRLQSRDRKSDDYGQAQPGGFTINVVSDTWEFVYEDAAGYADRIPAVRQRVD